MNDELNITLRIADLPAVALKIRREEEEAVRRARDSVDHLWKLLRRRYPDKSTAELLALAALQFARLSATATQVVDEAQAAAEEIEQCLDALLRGESPALPGASATDGGKTSAGK